MIILTKKLILEYLNSEKIVIENYVFKNVIKNFYYFRLGEKALTWNMIKKTFENTSINETTPLKLEAKGYARIWSHEKVTTSNSVFCLLGQSSSVQNKGFRLNYSPSIDIGFNGYLELGVENLLNIPQEITFLEVIGKIIFFDVSSSLNVDEMIDNYWVKIMKQRQKQQWSNVDDETDLFE